MAQALTERYADRIAGLLSCYDRVTALMVASELGSAKIARALIAARADVNAKANNGATALVMVSQNDHIELVRALVSASADVNAQTADGDTALTIATRYGHQVITQFLKASSPPTDKSSNVAANAADCSTKLTVQLETFGGGVTIELRPGIPGNSRIAESQRSSGGTVNFGSRCHGSYFMAIGDGDEVEVTPVRKFEDNSYYQSRIVVQHGSGNLKRTSRSTL